MGCIFCTCKPSLKVYSTAIVTLSPSTSFSLFYYIFLSFSLLFFLSFTLKLSFESLFFHRTSLILFSLFFSIFFSSSFLPSLFLPLVLFLSLPPLTLLSIVSLFSHHHLSLSLYGNHLLSFCSSFGPIFIYALDNCFEPTLIYALISD